MLGKPPHHAVELFFVAAYRALELLERLAQLAGHIGKCASVFRQTRPTPTRAGREELWADAWVEADHLHHFVHIGAGRLADIGHGVDETQSCGQKCVGGMFGEFGRGDVGHDHRHAEHVVQLTQTAPNDQLTGADQNAIRMEKVAHRTSFTQKLGVRRHVDITSADDGVQALGCTHRHGRTGNDDGARPHERADFGNDLFDIRKVG